MDIPKLLANMCSSDDAELYSALIKPVSIMAKDKEKDLLNVFMKFDLDKKGIFFTTIPYAVTGLVDETKYNYFGNNSAAARQFYITRDVTSIMNFWLGKPKGIMKNLYDILGNSILKDLLKECQENKLFDDHGICEDKVQFRTDLGKVNFQVKIGKEDKGLYVNDEKISPDKLINMCLDIESKGKFILIIPQIIKDGKTICISQDEAYLTAVVDSLQGEKKGHDFICHVCAKKKDDVNTVEYTAKLSKSSIGKVFVTTTVNYSPLFNKNGHQQNYSLCKACYEKILFGEKTVMRDYKIKVAGEDCVLLFSGIAESIDKEFLPDLKKYIDAAFNSSDFTNWEKGFIKDLKKQNIKTFIESNEHVYQFNTIFYRTDGKSTSVLKTIESISNIRLSDVYDSFENVKIEIGQYVRNLSLSHIYHMIPVSVNSKGEQLDIGRVLDFYSAILNGENIDKNLIFDFATEALEKGMRTLASSKVRNYKNLYLLEKMHGKDYGRDFYTAEMVMLYLNLIKVLQELKILNKEVLNFMVETNNSKIEYPEYILEMESFLKEHGFNLEQKRLFYIGVLTHLVGRMQYKQGHKTKPILDKISYYGMTDKEVLDFYLELQAKGRQYKNILEKSGSILVFEQIEGCIARNLSLPNSEKLTEKENVFYIKTGYSFCVLNYKNKNKGADENDNSEE